MLNQWNMNLDWRFHLGDVELPGPKSHADAYDWAHAGSRGGVAGVNCHVRLRLLQNLTANTKNHLKMLPTTTTNSAVTATIFVPTGWQKTKSGQLTPATVILI